MKNDQTIKTSASKAGVVDGRKLVENEVRRKIGSGTLIMVWSVFNFLSSFLQGNESSKADELPEESTHTSETSASQPFCELEEFPGFDDSHEVFITIGQVTKNVEFLTKEGF